MLKCFDLVSTPHFWELKLTLLSFLMIKSGLVSLFSIILVVLVIGAAQTAFLFGVNGTVNHVVLENMYWKQTAEKEG